MRSVEAANCAALVERVLLPNCAVVVVRIGDGSCALHSIFPCVAGYILGRPLAAKGSMERCAHLGFSPPRNCFVGRTRKMAIGLRC
jgi:hypothetical protein